MTTSKIFYSLMYQTKWTDFHEIQTSIIDVLDSHFNELSIHDNYYSIPGDRLLDRTIQFELHKDNRLQQVVEFLEHHAYEFWKQNNYTSQEKPYITQMWAIRTEKGGFTPPHSHHPYPISGAFYVNAPEDSGDFLIENPLQPLFGYMPYDMRWGPMTFDETIKTETGKLVMFPGWAKHYSKANNSEQRRYCIAFNYGYHVDYARNTG